jgi:hypothetical protein
MLKNDVEAAASESGSAPAEMNANNELEPITDSDPACSTLTLKDEGSVIHPAHNVETPNPELFVDPVFRGRGKFTASASQIAEEIARRTDDEIAAMVRNSRNTLSLAIQFSLHGRCVLGAGCWEMRRRIKNLRMQHKKSISWRAWCTSVGLHSPKSAKRWADNWETVQDTPAAFANAADSERIDLFLPRVAKVLRVINQELAGREPEPVELLNLIARLRAGITRKRSGLADGDRRNTRRPEISRDDASDSGDKLRVAASVEELRAFVVESVKQLGVDDPIWQTCATLPTGPTTSDVAQTLFRFMRRGEQEAFSKVWPEMLLGRLSREPEYPADSNSSKPPLEVKNHELAKKTVKSASTPSSDQFSMRVTEHKKSKAGREYVCEMCDQKITATQRYFEWAHESSIRRQHKIHGRPYRSRIAHSSIA